MLRRSVGQCNVSAMKLAPPAARDRRGRLANSGPRAAACSGMPGIGSRTESSALAARVSHSVLEFTFALFGARVKELHALPTLSHFYRTLHRVLNA